MTTRLRVILLILILGMLIHMILLIRNKKMQLQYTLTWVVLMLGLAVVVFNPNLLGQLTRLLGIYTPISMIFFVGFCVAIIIIYQLTQSVSVLSEQIKVLTQKVALLEKEAHVEDGEEQE